jgi:hypothetical protein
MKRTWWILLVCAALWPVANVHVHAWDLNLTSALSRSDDRILVFGDLDQMYYTVGELVRLGPWEAPQVLGARQRVQPTEPDLFDFVANQPSPEKFLNLADFGFGEGTRECQPNPVFSASSALSAPAETEQEISLVPEPQSSVLGIVAAGLACFGLAGKWRKGPPK